ncbi:MAG: hypothetical protein GF307_02500, partial [candidate division Zixibacteria bacterium]|nr:hypothetical protein [candidate division Zixibacteria bacterium]
MYIKDYARVRGAKTLKYLVGVLVVSAVLFACGSVATRNKFYQPVRDFIKNQNYDAAAQLLDEERNRFGKKDRLLFYLDSGFAHHYAANLDTSNARLTLAENTAEELFTKSVTRGAASMVLNDNTLEYAGEDYEVLYSNLFKAINYSWKDKFDDVYVEIRRALLKLELLEQKYARANQSFHENKDEDDIDIDYEVEKVRFNNDAFARYLSMHVFAADGRWDDARIARDYLDDAFKSQPHIYYFDQPDVKYYSEDKAVLSVVAMAGPSPVKEALSLRLRTDDELDLIQVLYDSGPNKDAEYGHIPFPVKESFYVKFSLPKIVQRPSEIHSISLKIGEYSYGEL